MWRALGYISEFGLKYKYLQLQVVTEVAGDSVLDAESVNDLKKILKEMGYSSKAVEEILKFYQQTNAQ